MVMLRFSCLAFLCIMILQSAWSESRHYYGRYKKELTRFYKDLTPGLHIDQQTLRNEKKAKRLLRFAKNAGIKSITFEVKSTSALTSFEKIKSYRKLCNQYGLRTIGRWVMFKYKKAAPCAFKSTSGKKWRGEYSSFSNPLCKYAWDYNFYGVFKQKGRLIKRRGIIHYIEYFDEIELDYIRYPSRNLRHIRYNLNRKTIDKNLGAVGLSQKKLKTISDLKLNRIKQELIFSYLNYYLRKEEFKGKITLDVFASELLQCQNIGQHKLIGEFKIKPMLYLDKYHVPTGDLVVLINSRLNKTSASYSNPDLYFLSTYAYLKEAIKKYADRPDYPDYIMPYVKGWHNKGESSQKTIAEFVFQLKALWKLKIKTFTIWSLSRTISNFLLHVNKASLQLAQTPPEAKQPH